MEEDKYKPIFTGIIVVLVIVALAGVGYVNYITHRVNNNGSNSATQGSKDGKLDPNIVKNKTQEVTLPNTTTQTWVSESGQTGTADLPAMPDLSK